MSKILEHKRPYLKQKLHLYFDENFPLEIVDYFRSLKGWSKKCRIYSAYDFSNEEKDDVFQYNFCFRKKFILVTLDADYTDDIKYPFSTIPGIIIIKTKINDRSGINNCLANILTFLCQFPLPKNFIGDSKFQVSKNGCIMRARDTITRAVKTKIIKPGDSLVEVAKFFNYF